MPPAVNIRSAQEERLWIKNQLLARVTGYDTIGILRRVKTVRGKRRHTSSRYVSNPACDLRMNIVVAPEYVCWLYKVVVISRKAFLLLYILHTD